MKKIYELGAMTGLNKSEVNRITRFGVLGLLALALGGLAACFKAQKAGDAAGPEKPGTLQDLSNSVNTSTGTAGQVQDEGCGPYQGYPCGTRYYTVSRSDFGRAA